MSGQETPELREVRVGIYDHWTASERDGEPGARTLCGIYLAGTPVAPYSVASCEACARLMPWGPDAPAGAGDEVEAYRG